MIQPAIIPDDIREIAPPKPNVYMTEEAVEAAKAYPDQPIPLNGGKHVEKGYARKIARQAKNRSKKLNVYWTFLAGRKTARSTTRGRSSSATGASRERL